MDFDLSPEQTMLSDSVLRFGRERYAPEQWRERVRPEARFDRTLWRGMAELGWLSLTVPEEAGGYGGNDVDVMVVMEAMGRFLMLEPFVSTCVACAPLLGARTDLLEKVALGETIMALAVGEPNARYDLAFVQTRAVATKDGYVLDGVKSYAPDGGVADAFIIPARLYGDDDAPGGIALFLAPAQSFGLTVEAARAPDHSRNARLRLEAVHLDHEALIVGPDGGHCALEMAVDKAIVARLAEALGAMESLKVMTLEHLRTRTQFGVAIGSFQVLQHKMVDIAIACEEARSLVYAATLMLRGPETDRRRTVSAAKARVGQLGLFTARESVQLHGGVGASDELMVGHYLKRLMMIEGSFGSADHHLARFAALAA
jgi:alkylation response protein AidB-like acyl-CoA dehydrogenase